MLNLAVAAAITVVVGLLTQVGWPGYVIGAGLALSLWVLLVFGFYATEGRFAQEVPTPATWSPGATPASSFQTAPALTPRSLCSAPW